MTWHYVDGEEAVGPVSAEELQRLFRSRNIDARTFVWTEGMTEWQPLHEITALSHLLEPVPPPLRAPREPSATPRSTAPAPRRQLQKQPKPGVDPTGLRPAGPWTRYFARAIDLTVVGTILLALITYASLYASFELTLFIERTNAQILTILLLPITLATNGIIATLCGNTLGKVIFGIKVMPIDHRRKFGLIDNLRREMGIWLGGLGLGIPIVSLFYARVSLQEGQQGSADGL